MLMKIDNKFKININNKKYIDRNKLKNMRK